MSRDKLITSAMIAGILLLFVAAWAQSAPPQCTLPEQEQHVCRQCTLPDASTQSAGAKRGDCNCTSPADCTCGSECRCANCALHNTSLTSEQRHVEAQPATEQLKTADPYSWQLDAAGRWYRHVPPSERTLTPFLGQSTVGGGYLPPPVGVPFALGGGMPMMSGGRGGFSGFSGGACRGGG